MSIEILDKPSIDDLRKACPLTCPLNEEACGNDIFTQEELILTGRIAVSDKHCFNESSLKTWWERSDIHPMTRRKMDPPYEWDLRVERILKDLMGFEKVTLDTKLSESVPCKVNNQKVFEFIDNWSEVWTS